jgi:Ca-activated chloride channel homolog
MKRVMVILFLACVSHVTAGTTGKLTGFVKDAKTGIGLVGVNVIIEKTSMGAVTDTSGKYMIYYIPPGKVSVRFTMMGYESLRKKNIRIKADSVTVLNVNMKSKQMEGEQVTITAKKAEIRRDVSTAVLSYAPSATVSGLQSPFVTHDTEEYSKIDETGFRDVLQHPLSTFAADVDAASYSNSRRFIMDSQLPPKDAVRVEEFVNYFDYDYPQPKAGMPFSISLEWSACPWNGKHDLIHIGLQGKKLDRQDAKPSNLVFLLDVSGSMRDENKLPLLKTAFKMLVDQLRHEDRIAIVVYASAVGLHLPSTAGSDRSRIKAAIDELTADGSTAGGEGLRIAYDTAKENYIAGGNNRVILATDGDFNVGVSSTSELVRFIEEKRKDGIFLTILGFGMGNYKDDRLQELADRGNGNHYYIDNILEAKKVLVRDLTSTLFTIAKDVKIQVEFNPAKIGSYRLIGYENRALNAEDFKDDRKDAGEIGAGHEVTALYEVVPRDRTDGRPESLDLKYQTTAVKDGALASDDVMTVRVRAKDPDGDDSREYSEVLKGDPVPLDRTSGNFRFSAAVAEFAMILRDSEFKGDSNLDGVNSLAGGSIGSDPDGMRAEFLDLVSRVDALMKNP